MIECTPCRRRASRSHWSAPSSQLTIPSSHWPLGCPHNYQYAYLRGSHNAAIGHSVVVTPSVTSPRFGFSKLEESQARARTNFLLEARVICSLMPSGLSPRYRLADFPARPEGRTATVSVQDDNRKHVLSTETELVQIRQGLAELRVTKGSRMKPSPT